MTLDELKDHFIEELREDAKYATSYNSWIEYLEAVIDQAKKIQKAKTLNGIKEIMTMDGSMDLQEWDDHLYVIGWHKVIRKEE